MDQENKNQNSFKSDPEITKTETLEEIQSTKEESRFGKILMDELLLTTIKRNASDLHLTVGLPPTLRIDGKLVPLVEKPILDPSAVHKMVFSLLNDEQRTILEKNKELDFSYSYNGKGRFRINAFHEKNNIACALRLIPGKIRTVKELNLPLIIEDFTKHSQGFVLVTGPTGHGKSTTLAALVEKINKERADHIITIEDPIEYVHTHKKAMIAQREIHTDTHSFARALRSALREDPDVVLIGEMRDLETIAAALTIAETGHLVFATLHTNTAAQTVDRIVDVFPPHQQPQVRVQLSQIILGIVSQRLLPRIGGGRIVACEVLFANPAVRNLIRENKAYQITNVIQTGKEEKMVSLDKTLAELVQRGKITLADAEMYALDIKFLRGLLGKT
jgi:twitching motility protein PilT